jgi:hypothetical protein
MAEQSKSRGELGAAIAYSLSAGDAERADSLICSALHKFGTSPSAIKELSTIVSSASEALTNGGDTAAENNNLHFLRSYCRFHALLKVSRDR